MALLERQGRVGRSFPPALPGKGPGSAKLSRGLGCFLLILLTSCRFIPSPSRASIPSVFPTRPEVHASATPLAEPASAGFTPSPTLTVVLVPGSTPGTVDAAGEILPSPAVDPLRFVFPSPAPAPVSAWRPPLYPTPWALSPHDHFYFARPIAADEVNWPLWDYRYGGSFFEDVIHTGIDIVVGKGTPVLAAGSGKVVWAGYGVYRGFDDPTDPYGLAVVVYHDFGYQGQSLYTVYGHLDQVDVVPGQPVDVGDLLGLSGETGHVTGPHLHFEVRLGQNGFLTTRNPELWLVPPQGWGVLAGRISDGTGQLKIGQDVIIHSLSSGQNWLAKTYGAEAVNSDSYYGENLVIGDLPAGPYEIRIPYDGFNHTLEIQILPGVVNYFSYRSYSGFSTSLPTEPSAESVPSTWDLPAVTPEAGWTQSP